MDIKNNYFHSLRSENNKYLHIRFFRNLHTWQKGSSWSADWLETRNSVGEFEQNVHRRWISI